MKVQQLVLVPLKFLSMTTSPMKEYNAFQILSTQEGINLLVTIPLRHWMSTMHKPNSKHIFILSANFMCCCMHVSCLFTLVSLYTRHSHIYISIVVLSQWGVDTACGRQGCSVIACVSAFSGCLEVSIVDVICSDVHRSKTVNLAKQSQSHSNVGFTESHKETCI